MTDSEPTAPARETPSVEARPKVVVDVAALSHPGKERDNNEDHFLVAAMERSLRVLSSNLPEGVLPPRLDQAGYCFVVADGMGGAAAGEVASRVAIEAGLQLQLSRATWFIRVDAASAERILERMREVLVAADSAVAKAAEDDDRLAGMGTTMTLAFAIGADLFIAHIGDSRAYLLHEGKLLQLTRDQTIVEELVAIGRLPPDLAGRHPLRHVLTHALGEGKQELPVELLHFWLADGDRVLLCSDGLHDAVARATIQEVVGRAATPDEACKGLVESALAAGGPDNVTVVAAFFRVPEGYGGDGVATTLDDTTTGGT